MNFSLPHLKIRALKSPDFQQPLFSGHLILREAVERQPWIFSRIVFAARDTAVHVAVREQFGMPFCWPFCFHFQHVEDSLRGPLAEPSAWNHQAALCRRATKASSSLPEVNTIQTKQGNTRCRTRIRWVFHRIEDSASYCCCCNCCCCCVVVLHYLFFAILEIMCAVGFVCLRAVCVSVHS